MYVMPLIKGVAAGAAVGTVYYVVSKSSKRQRNSLRKNTGRAVKSFVTVLSDISDMM